MSKRGCQGATSTKSPISPGLPEGTAKNCPNKTKATKNVFINKFRNTLCADAKVSSRVKAVNTLLNSGLDLDTLKKVDIKIIWESVFYALWYAEMGKGFEEIIKATVRGCNLEMTKIGFRQLSKSWFGLDQHRLDKFRHLARHLTARMIQIQIKIWFKRPIYPVIYPMLMDIKDSIGLSYFVTEVFVEELHKALEVVYVNKNIYVGHSKLKSKILAFMYKQFFMFITDRKFNYDYRMLATIDNSIFKAFITNHLTNESQMTQILVSLRFKEILEKYTKKKKSKNFVIHRKILLKMCRWIDIMENIHESCISGEYFPDSLLPRPVEIRISKDPPNQ